MSPPWMRRERRRVVLTMRAIAKVTEVASKQGVTFSTALDALVRLAPHDQVEQTLAEDASTEASWTLYGGDPAR